MDTNKLIAETKARFNHYESKLYLTEKYTNKLTFAAQSGMWTASPELIGFLRSSTYEYSILRDNYNVPVRVNIIELLKSMEEVYNSTMDNWYNEYNELKSKR